MAMIDTERYAQELSKLRETVEKAADALHLPQLEEELTELKEEMNEPEFWNDLQRSTTVNRKVGQIEGKINHVARLRSRADDIEAMLMLLNEEPDEEMGAECEKELADLTADADALELETMMRGEYDSCNAVLSLHAGAGGTEAQDWTSMLYRMYTRYCERHGFKVTVNDILEGDEAGLKSVTFQVEGENAYGFLRSERGVPSGAYLSLRRQRPPPHFLQFAGRGPHSGGRSGLRGQHGGSPHRHLPCRRRGRSAR